jgi:hypothetical protein
LVGVALGYYVRKEEGGRVDTVINDESYKAMT